MACDSTVLDRIEDLIDEIAGMVPAADDHHGGAAAAMVEQGEGGSISGTGPAVAAAGLLREVQEALAADRARLEQLVGTKSEELLEAQRQVLQNERLASVGRLAAGVAHEINTPIQYVGDNLRALSDFFNDLTSLVAKYRDLVHLAKSGQLTPAAIDDIAAAEEQHDLAYIMDDAPKAIEQGLEGVARVAHIVRAMKDFSHVDREEVSSIDVNRALENTLTVARNEYKYVADVETDFGELPAVQAYTGELRQVFLNLIVNAAHAIAETQRRGRITLRTRADGDHVEITIADTGCGIPDEVRDRVFDPFFTTKAVGKGTGQGLNIAHNIVVGKHGGELTFESEIGRGTTFWIRLPVRVEAESAPEAEAIPT